MDSAPRLTYNIVTQNNDNDQNNSYYTYNANNYENINKDNNLRNKTLSILNLSTPLTYNPVYTKENKNNISNLNNINNIKSPNNLNNDSFNDSRFSRLHSRLDEINDKINKEKMQKENFIHSKINTTEMLLNNNNEVRERKLKEIKSSIR